MKRVIRGVLLGALLFVGSARAETEAGARFPHPDFESGYTLPQPTAPGPRLAWTEYADVAALAVALALASYLALRARSRRGLVLLGLLCLLYFGFWRRGCVCPVGSVQNLASALADPAQPIAFSVLAIFLLPLAFTLLFGRTFCAAVCPLGVVQDLVVLAPLRLPPAVGRALGLLPYAVLGFAVLFAATGAGFIVCRYDPFVAIFRLSGPALMLWAGAGILLLGAFVARPFCRFLCPYGVLLHWLSRVAWRHAAITPDDCIQCRLCEDSCPFDAIRWPTPPRAPGARAAALRRTASLLLLVPCLAAAGAWLGTLGAPALSRMHPEVRLADQLVREDAGLTKTRTLESDAFRAGERTLAEQLQGARAASARFRTGAAWLGGFLGLAAGLLLTGFSTRPATRDYIPHRGECLSCGRCYRYCPREHLRLARKEARRP